MLVYGFALRYVRTNRNTVFHTYGFFLFGTTHFSLNYPNVFIIHCPYKVLFYRI